MAVKATIPLVHTKKSTYQPSKGILQWPTSCTASVKWNHDSNICLFMKAQFSKVFLAKALLLSKDWHVLHLLS